MFSLYLLCDSIPIRRGSRSLAPMLFVATPFKFRGHFGGGGGRQPPREAGGGLCLSFNLSQRLSVLIPGHKHYPLWTIYLCRSSWFLSFCSCSPNHFWPQLLAGRLYSAPPPSNLARFGSFLARVSLFSKILRFFKN